MPNNEKFRYAVIQGTKKKKTKKKKKKPFLIEVRLIGKIIYTKMCISKN